MLRTLKPNTWNLFYENEEILRTKVIPIFLILPSFNKLNRYYYSTEKACTASVFH